MRNGKSPRTPPPGIVSKQGRARRETIPGTKKGRKPAKKVKSLPTRAVKSKNARSVKGGDVRHADLTVPKLHDKASAKIYEQ